MSSYKLASVPQFSMGSGTGRGVPVKVLHLTDLHLHVKYPVSRLAALVRQINAQQPDIVVFTGDLLRWATPLPHAPALARALGRIRAPLGKFAVRGNHDLRGDGEQVPYILQAAGFEFLNNRTRRLTLADGTPFWVSGMDDGWYKLAKRGHLWVLRGRPGFKLMLVHEPVLARTVPPGAADLILAGHTHGGQMHLPKVEKLWMPDFSSGMYHGFYHVNGATLYVSAGLGESALPLRLFCPPEMPLFTIWAE